MASFESPTYNIQAFGLLTPPPCPSKEFDLAPHKPRRPSASKLSSLAAQAEATPSSLSSTPTQGQRPLCLQTQALPDTENYDPRFHLHQHYTQQQQLQQATAEQAYAAFTPPALGHDPDGYFFEWPIDTHAPVIDSAVVAAAGLVPMNTNDYTFADQLPIKSEQLPVDTWQASPYHEAYPTTYTQRRHNATPLNYQIPSAVPHPSQGSSMMAALQSPYYSPYHQGHHHQQQRQPHVDTAAYDMSFFGEAVPVPHYMQDPPYAPAARPQLVGADMTDEASVHHDLNTPIYPPSHDPYLFPEQPILTPSRLDDDDHTQSCSPEPIHDTLVSAAGPELDSPQPHQDDTTPSSPTKRPTSRRAKCFACPICSNTFTRAYNLREHMQVHESIRVRSHACHMCPRAYFRNADLSRHMKTRHNVSRNSTTSSNGSSTGSASPAAASASASSPAAAGPLPRKGKRQPGAAKRPPQHQHALHHYSQQRHMYPHHHPSPQQSSSSQLPPPPHQQQHTALLPQHPEEPHQQQQQPTSLIYGHELLLHQNTMNAMGNYTPHRHQE